MSDAFVFPFANLRPCPPRGIVYFAILLRSCLTLCVDPELLAQVEAEVKKEIEIIKELSAYASQYPYYK